MGVHLPEDGIDQAGARKRYHIIGVIAVATLTVLSGCNGLPGGAATAVVLLPTRTLAPVRTMIPVTPDPTHTPAPATPATTSIGPINDSATVTPLPTRISSMASCATVKFDTTATAAKTASVPGRIVYVTSIGNINVIDASSKNAVQITSDANTDAGKGAIQVYAFPTFSGDGKSVAFVGYNTISGTDTVTQTLYVALDEPKASARTLYTTTAENIPYMDWSPDGKQIAFLTIRSGTGAMRLINKNGGKATIIDEGSSAYWHWRYDSAALLTHLSGSPATNADAHMSIAELTSSGAKDFAGAKKITSQPGNFKAPQYSPNGKYILYVIRTNDNDDLALADANGKPLCSLATLDSGASFAWSPDGRRIAWIESTLTTQNPAPLRTFDLATGALALLHDQATAFFWSPDSKHILVYSIVLDGTSTEYTAAGSVDTVQSGQTQTGDPMLRIEVVDSSVSTPASVQIADSFPTRGVIDVINFFDQYSRAVTPWSPDGKQLVFTSASHAQSRLDLVVATLNGTSDKVDLNRIGDGVVAFWSPR